MSTWGLAVASTVAFGAPLARMEAQIAFTELVQRLSQPPLVVDPPPYRPSPLLRGPEHLLIEVDGVRESAGEHEGRRET